MTCSGAWAYRQADRGTNRLCSDAASGTCDSGSIWRRGYQINGGLRSISWDRTGSVRYVFRAADRRRLRSIYVKEQEIRKKRCICIWTISCIRTGAGGIIWRSDRYMVFAFFIKRVTNKNTLKFVWWGSEQLLKR